PLHDALPISADLFLELLKGYALPLVELPHRLANGLDGLSSLDAIEHGLIGLGVLHDERRLAVDRENQGALRLLDPANVVLRPPLEVSEGVNVFEIDH